MKLLFEGLYSKFTSDPLDPLYVAIGGRFFFARAPQKATRPYVVAHLERGEPIYSSLSQIEDVDVHLYVMAVNLTSLLDLSGKVKTLFDDCELTVDGHQFIQFERQGEDYVETDDDTYVCYVIEYKCLIEKEF